MQAISVSDRSAVPAVARWIRRTLAADPPRAKSLIVTVWGDALAPHGGSGLARGPHPADGAVRHQRAPGAHQRIPPRADGWLARATQGRRSRYRLTRDGARRFDDAYRRIYERPADDWRRPMGARAGRCASPRGAAPRCARSLPGRDSASSDRPRSCVPHEAARALPSMLARRAASPSSVAVAIGADLPGSGRSPAVRRQRMGPGGAGRRLPAISRALRRGDRALSRRRRARPAQCFIVRTLLIHAYRRVLLRDPLLPAGAAAARLAGRGGLCAVPRLLSPDAPRRRAAPRGDAVGARRAMAPGRRRVLSQVRGPAAGIDLPGCAVHD